LSGYRNGGIEKDPDSEIAAARELGTDDNEKRFNEKLEDRQTEACRSAQR
jgi:hypothetical protein